jgi:FAD synthetase
MSELNEEPGVRARKYIANLTTAFQRITIKTEDTSVTALNIGRVSDSIRRYLQDARHYLDEGRATTSLASVAYAEGLLDALTFLELTQDGTTQ